ncbi:PA domain-containing protein [Streptomyces sanglieri]|uniref:PA domain-containing protein n=1 Tax=Streptomyces sanglieri TaxID=193460 RepID=UPI0035263A5C
MAWSSIGSEYGASTLQAVDAGMARPEDLAGKDLNGKIAVVTRESTPFSYTKSAELIAAVTDAGAKAVILVNDRPGPFATQVSRVTGTAIPAWSLTQDEGAVLFGRMADSPTGNKLQGITGVPQVYNIAMMVPGGIPADPTDAVTAENSTVMKSHYRSTKGTRIGDVDSAIRPIEGVVFDVVNFFDAPLDREEWYSTGSRSPMMKDIRWWHRINPDRADISRTVRDGLRTYQPGEQREQTWLGAANGPAGPEASQAVREGDNVTIPEMGDSRGHAGFFENDADKRTARIYQDGKLIREAPRLLQTTLPVSPDPATYRVTLDTQPAAWFPLSTKTSTAWTFKSSRPASDKESLALLWPMYGLDLDAENTARGGRTDHFDLGFALQTGTTPDIRGVEVTMSTDDGDTWHPAKVKSAKGDSYKVTLRNPDSGYVSLRVKAWDANGSKIEQTLIRAYAVR